MFPLKNFHKKFLENPLDSSNNPTTKFHFGCSYMSVYASIKKKHPKIKQNKYFERKLDNEEEKNIKNHPISISANSFRFSLYSLHFFVVFVYFVCKE